MSVLLRPAEPSDAPFLAEMLVAAVLDDMEQPELAHYVTGWPRPSDLGVVA